MKDDLKNVIITISLIGLAYSQGALMYQKKLLNDYILSKEVLPQASLNINDSQNPVLDPNLGVVKVQATETAAKSAVKTTQPQTTNNSAAIKAANEAELARIKAQLIAQQQAQAIADQKAAQAAATQAAQAQQTQYQSRQSRAS